MERVTFLVADTGSRISCLLNPEKLVRRRLAGLRTAVSGSGVLAGPAASDDVLISTGGGRTELDLELLFDVELTPAQAAPAAAVDVRDLTKPLWDLAENGPTRTGPAAVRFCWGLWNVLCVVTAVAEQLERFDASGTPGRSWLTMRLVRVPDPIPAPAPMPMSRCPPARRCRTSRRSATWWCRTCRLWSFLPPPRWKRSPYRTSPA